MVLGYTEYTTKFLPLSTYGVPFNTPTNLFHLSVRFSVFLVLFVFQAAADVCCMPVISSIQDRTFIFFFIAVRMSSTITCPVTHARRFRSFHVVPNVYLTIRPYMSVFVYFSCEAPHRTVSQDQHDAPLIYIFLSWKWEVSIHNFNMFTCLILSLPFYSWSCVRRWSLR